MVTKALYVPLKPKAGKESDLEEFLANGLGLAQEEPETITWYAFKESDGTYAIFDTFEGDEGRQAHLDGKVAEALMANADELLEEEPEIHHVDVLAAKVPGQD
jgi:quinol monooxygenase YgiN